MARTTGIEPATTGSTVRYSNQLSYVPKLWEVLNYTYDARVSKTVKHGPKSVAMPDSAVPFASARVTDRRHRSDCKTLPSRATGI